MHIVYLLIYNVYNLCVILIQNKCHRYVSSLIHKYINKTPRVDHNKITLLKININLINVHNNTDYIHFTEYIVCTLGWLRGLHIVCNYYPS